MAHSVGIVGLPNVGKSTLFNAITQAGAESANYPFCTIDPNVGVVAVPDARLDKLTELVTPKKTVATAFEFVDIAGLVKGASRGEGLGNKFLANIREVDAIAHVVRCFEDGEVTHVSGKVDPLSDIETINIELILADLESVEKRIDRLRKQLKSQEKNAQIEFELLERIQQALANEQPARTVEVEKDQLKVFKSFNLLTQKPVLYVANVHESEFTSGEINQHVEKVKHLAEQEGSGLVIISAKVEAEIAELDGEDKQMFLEELGIKQSGLDILIYAAYQLLGLDTYFTAGEQEVRAWTIHRGTKAPQAAGVIHTDFERGFIRAEVVHFDELVSSGSLAVARDKGLLRSEGKEYIVKDGDVIHFRFNV